MNFLCTSLAGDALVIRGISPRGIKFGLNKSMGSIVRRCIGKMIRNLTWGGLVQMKPSISTNGY